MVEFFDSPAIILHTQILRGAPPIKSFTIMNSKGGPPPIKSFTIMYSKGGAPPINSFSFWRMKE